MYIIVLVHYSETFYELINSRKILHLHYNGYNTTCLPSTQHHVVITHSKALSKYHAAYYYSTQRHIHKAL